MKVAAIIAAGGQGTRLVKSDSVAKQFLELKGRQMYVWCLETILKAPSIGNVVLVVPEAALKEVSADIEKNFAKDSQRILVTAGGATRQESVRIGMDRLTSFRTPPLVVLVHDAARPFISIELVEAVVREARNSGACTVGMPPSDTVKKIQNGAVAETLDRSTLLMVQTPQAARFDWLLEAHTKAAKDGMTATDDAALLEMMGRKVTVVKGSPFNLKVTHPEDLILGEAIAGIAFSDRV